jgi:FtsH-binding integral membrane protein
LTAYDTQKLRQLYLGSQGVEPGGFRSGNPRFAGAAFDTTRTSPDKLSVIGALILYLDFVNLFLALLRLFGRRR